MTIVTYSQDLYQLQGPAPTVISPWPMDSGISLLAYFFRYKLKAYIYTEIPVGSARGFLKMPTAANLDGLRSAGRLSVCENLIGPKT
jgi:hypothetical protein